MLAAGRGRGRIGVGRRDGRSRHCRVRSDRPVRGRRAGPVRLDGVERPQRDGAPGHGAAPARKGAARLRRHVRLVYLGRVLPGSLAGEGAKWPGEFRRGRRHASDADSGRRLAVGAAFPERRAALDRLCGEREVPRRPGADGPDGQGRVRRRNVSCLARVPRLLGWGGRRGAARLRCADARPPVFAGHPAPLPGRHPLVRRGGGRGGAGARLPLLSGLPPAPARAGRGRREGGQPGRRGRPGRWASAGAYR